MNYNEREEVRTLLKPCPKFDLDPKHSDTMENARARAKRVLAVHKNFTVLTSKLSDISEAFEVIKKDGL